MIEFVNYISCSLTILVLLSYPAYFHLIFCKKCYHVIYYVIYPENGPFIMTEVDNFIGNCWMMQDHLNLSRILVYIQQLRIIKTKNKQWRWQMQADRRAER